MVFTEITILFSTLHLLIIDLCVEEITFVGHYVMVVLGWQLLSDNIRDSLGNHSKRPTYVGGTVTRSTTDVYYSCSMCSFGLRFVVHISTCLEGYWHSGLSSSAIGKMVGYTQEANTGPTLIVVRKRAQSISI